MTSRVICIFVFVLVLTGSPAFCSFEAGHYYPIYLGAHWIYQDVENPGIQRNMTVCCPDEIDGQPAVRLELEGVFEIACWKDGPTVIFYGKYDNDGEFEDFIPDVVLGSMEDGSKFSFSCETVPCDSVLVRVWDQLDHPDLYLYGIDPGYENLILEVYYDAGYPVPTHQNEIVESNLPPGILPPPGAVTDLSWKLLGVGEVVSIDVQASSGELGQKFVLVGVSGETRSIPEFGTKFQLGQNHPNPFNPQTTIAFELPKRSSVNLRVFDMSGRLVKDLITAEPYESGRHEVVWNGRDDNGHQVASGTYFYRLEAGLICETKKMVLVK